MGPLGKLWLYAALDAHSCAAAGRKLTLDWGLGKEKISAKKRAGIAPCPAKSSKTA
jgi:hypothetical protein